MTTGEKLLAIIDNEYLKFAHDMNLFHLDTSLALIVLDSMRAKLLEQIHKEGLENKVKEELENEDK